jgi:hypothetical protein
MEGKFNGTCFKCGTYGNITYECPNNQNEGKMS